MTKSASLVFIMDLCLRQSHAVRMQHRQLALSVSNEEQICSPSILEHISMEMLPMLLVKKLNARPYVAKFQDELFICPATYAVLILHV
jgi:hypothetical protein